MTLIPPDALFPALNHCPLRHQSIHRPTAIAIQLESVSITFRQLDQWVEDSCRIYHKQGVKPGDRMLFITVNPLDTVLTALACLRSQWIFCPVSPAFPAEQKQGYQQRIGAALVADSTGIDYSTNRQLPSEQELQPIEIPPETIYDLVATSGTSGIPKAVAHSYSNHYYNALGASSVLPLTHGDSWLLSLPLFHVGGLAIVLRCLLAGATMVIDHRGDVKTALHDTLTRQRLTHLSLVNTQLFRLLQSGLSLHDNALRYILLGGGAAAPRLVKAAQDQGIMVLTTYGMTEMASQICTGEPHFTDTGVTSGGVLPWREVALSDQGEILVRGKTLAKGYFANGELLPLPGADGWFHTGDKGLWCNDQIQLCGRMDNMMISGGENIHPEELEQALLTLNNIVQAVVVAKADDEFGQRPVAYVQTLDGTLDEASVRQHLAGMMAKFKVPVHIRLFPESITEPGIKPNRRLFQSLEQTVSL